MRILHFYSGGARGGVQAMFRRTVLGLAAEGVTQALVLGMAEDASPYTAAHIPVTTARFRNRFTDLLTHLCVRRVMRAMRPDVIQVWPHRANWFVRGGRGTVPVVRFLGGPASSRRVRKFYHDADALLVPGKGTAQTLIQQGWPADRTGVLRHFAASTPVVPWPRPDGVLVVGVGRLSPEKGFDLLVEALAGCAEMAGWLVGDGPERARLEQLTEQLTTGHTIRFWGWQEDPNPLLAAADIVVVPSREESFGLVILEAWAQGKAVIATACDGPAALICDGETGLLVPRDDPAALAAAIRRLAADADLRQRLGAAGAAQLAATYSEQRAMRELLQFYQNLLEQSGG